MSLSDFYFYGVYALIHLKNKLVIGLIFLFALSNCSQKKYIGQKDLWYFMMLGKSADVYFRLSRQEVWAIDALKKDSPRLSELLGTFFAKKFDVFNKMNFILGSASFLDEKKSVRIIINGEYKLSDFKIKKSAALNTFGSKGFPLFLRERGYSVEFYPAKRSVFIYKGGRKRDFEGRKSDASAFIKKLRDSLERNNGSWIIIKNTASLYDKYLKNWDILKSLQECLYISAYLTYIKDENALRFRFRMFFSTGKNIDTLVLSAEKIYNKLLSKYSYFRKRIYEYSVYTYRRSVEFAFKVKIGIT